MNKLPTVSLFGFYGMAKCPGLSNRIYSKFANDQILFFICFGIKCNNYYCTKHLSYIMLSNKPLIYIIFIDMVQVDPKEGSDYNTIQSRIQ